MLNQISVSFIIFANENLFRLFGAHELKNSSSWLVRFKNYDNSKSFVKMES